MPFFLTENFVPSLAGIAVGLIAVFAIRAMRQDQRNPNNPKWHRRNMWVAPLALLPLAGGIMLKHDYPLTSRIVIGLLLILLGFLSYRIHSRKWKQALQAENKNEEQGEVDE